MRFNCPPHDRKTETRSTRLTRTRFVDAVEALEHFRLMLNGNAGSAIDDFDYGLVRVTRYSHQQCPPVGGILNCVIDEIYEGLPEDQKISRHCHAFVTLHDQ